MTGSDYIESLILVGNLAKDGLPQNYSEIARTGAYADAESK